MLLLAASPLLAAPKYHLELEAQPGAVFPYLTKFGKLAIDVYPGGVRTETFWLNGFSRNGSSTITVLNPVGRMYTDVPIASISSLLQKLGSTDGEEKSAGLLEHTTMAGKVGTVAATRHRLKYGPAAYIDYWTTTAIPQNAQVRHIVSELVTAISPATGKAVDDIAGTPIYVELNFRRFHKVALLKFKSVFLDVSGEEEALSVGSFYVKAPLLDSLWK